MEELKQLMISQNSEVNQNIANLDTKIGTISEDILSIRDVIIKKLQEENSALKERIDKLEETVYHLQDERILSLENKMGNVEKKMGNETIDLRSTKRNSFANDQYSRLNNIEIEGIPVRDNDNGLVNTVTDILSELGIKVSDTDFEGCHRLKTRVNLENPRPVIPTTICRFVNRSVCEVALKNRKNLKGKTINNIKNIYINENLNAYYKRLAAKCRRLKNNSLIIDTWTFKGIPRIKLANGDQLFITHEYDLDKIFPDFVYFDK